MTSKALSFKLFKSSAITLLIPADFLHFNSFNVCLASSNEMLLFNILSTLSVSSLLAGGSLGSLSVQVSSSAARF